MDNGKCREYFQGQNMFCEINRFSYMIHISHVQYTHIHTVKALIEPHSNVKSEWETTDFFKKYLIEPQGLY